MILASGVKFEATKRKKWNFLIFVFIIFSTLPRSSAQPSTSGRVTASLERMKKYTLSSGGRASISLGPCQVLLSDLCAEWWNANVLARKINARFVRRAQKRSRLAYTVFRDPPPVRVPIRPPAILQHAVYILQNFVVRLCSYLPSTSDGNP